MTILIQNGQVINPATGMNEVADVLVENGVVSKIEKGIKEKADRKINAKGCFVMPGFIDMHVHLRDPGFEEKETIETGCRAAAHGGYTTILAMPNTKPVVDNPDVVNYVHNKAKTVGLVNVLQVGAVTKNQEGKELADIEGMVKAGIPAISEDGKSVMNAQLYREAMEKAAKLGIVVLAHCEDKNLVNGGVMNEDEHARELGLKGITNSVEDIIVARDIMLSNDTGAKLHLCHCSTEDSVMMVDLAKQKNVKVTAEVCPHHFTLTSDDIVEGDTNYKMNPPLRSEADRQATIAAVADGTVDLLATDHAPHTMEEKELGFLDAPNGIIGLECAYGICHKVLVDGGFISDERLIELMSTGPAELMGHDKTDITAVLDDYADAVPGDDDTKRVLDLGRVPESDQVDLVVLNTGEEWTVDPEKFHSSARNTPFGGWQVTGRPLATIIGSKLAFSRIDKED